jgi:hypothetical protein
MKRNVQDVGSRLQQTMSTEFAWYITGFVDGEGCFSISFNKRDKLKTGIEIRPSFSIAQNKRNLPILKRVKIYFECGAIRFSRYDQIYKYETRSIGDIRKQIIPHFQKYPLQTNKAQDFATFSWICDEIAASRHLNKDCLIAIIDRAYTMNESGKRRYTKEELLKIIEAR